MAKKNKVVKVSHEFVDLLATIAWHGGFWACDHTSGKLNKAYAAAGTETTAFVIAKLLQAGLGMDGTCGISGLVMGLFCPATSKKCEVHLSTWRHRIALCIRKVCPGVMFVDSLDPCLGCGEELTSKEINGGRCFSCGRMIT